MSSASFAYRLPNSSASFYFHGKLVPYAGKAPLPERAFLIHDFYGESIFLITDLKEITADEFHIYTSDQTQIHQTSFEDYARSFGFIKQKLETAEADKIVLSRIKEHTTQETCITLFNKLNAAYQTTYNYLISSDLLGTWLAASPELLLNCIGQEVSTVSLAGTKPSDSDRDWTPKELEEQAMVTSFIESAFNTQGIKHLKKSERYTIQAGPVSHLKTDISGQLPANQSEQNLLNELHPTSATCGLPKEASMKIIREAENHNRLLYTGYIGIIDKNQRTYFVNLRCMKVEKNRVLLFVGGGITRASELESEWQETEKKALTLERIL